MRRITVLFVLALAATLWSAVSAQGHTGQAASGATASVRADFDDDGLADLAIGIPFEDVGSLADAGAVSVLYGTTGGLSGTGSQLFTQDTPGVPGVAEASDRFGNALAAGDFNRDDVDDLAVGAPLEGVGTGFDAGLSGTGSQLLTQDTPGVPDTAEFEDWFGSALAAGDFNNDGVDDLAVGARRENLSLVEEAGAVNVLYGTAGGLSGTGSQLLTQDSPGVPDDTEDGDTFGAPLAAGDFNNDSVGDLAVGVPFEQHGGGIGAAGAVNVLYGTAGGLSGTGSQLLTQDSPGVGGVAEFGDIFGGTLAASDFDDDGVVDLAVGAPGEDVGSLADAGAVSVLYGTAGGLSGTGSQLLTQDHPGVPGVAEEDDRFGAALAAGDFDNDSAGDLTVGVPEESLGGIGAAGAVSVLYGTSGGLSGTGSQLLTQDHPGVGGSAEPGDRFGWTLHASKSGIPAAAASPSEPGSRVRGAPAQQP
jgi:hypothetical protein